MTSTSDFQALRNATLQAAQDLYSVNSAERNSVNMAWCLVGVSGTGCPPSNLTGSGFIFASRRWADLSWQSHAWPAFDVFRNGVKIATTYNSYYTNSYSTSAYSANYWVCWAGSTTWYDSRYCSNVITVSFSYPVTITFRSAGRGEPAGALSSYPLRTVIRPVRAVTFLEHVRPRAPMVEVAALG